MCGRYTLRTNPQRIAEQFELDELPLLTARYNIAPSQTVGATYAAHNPSGAIVRRWADFTWGLLPAWSESPTGGQRPINARSETAAEKPTFREAFRRRRCLIPADGFYEWRREGKEREPFYFTLRDEGLFAFAGLFEHWQAVPGQSSPDDVASCTILTTEANGPLREFHDRMPVILEPQDYAAWLDPTVEDAARVQPLCRSLDAAKMQHWPVSQRVNGPKRDEPECIRPFRQPRLFD